MGDAQMKMLLFIFVFLQYLVGTTLDFLANVK